MHYYFQVKNELDWERLKALRYDRFPRLAPQKVHCGTIIKKPFPFSELIFDEDAKVLYFFSIKDGILSEKFRFSLDKTIEWLYSEIKISEKDQEEFIKYIQGIFHIDDYFQVSGDVPSQTATRIKHLCDKKKAGRYRLDFSSYYEEGITKRVMVKLVDTERGYHRMDESEILLSCYPEGYVSLHYQYWKTNQNRELQEQALHLLMELYEEFKIELLFVDDK